MFKGYVLHVCYLYRLCVSDKMMEKGYTTFRDVEELEQATRFLHENGKDNYKDIICLSFLVLLMQFFLPLLISGEKSRKVISLLQHISGLVGYK